MAVSILIVVVLFDILNCWIYCSYRKYERKKKIRVESTVERKDRIEDYKSFENVTNNKTQNKTTVLHKIKNKYIWPVANIYFSAMESLMRLSLKIVSVIPSHHIRNILLVVIFKMDISKRTVIYGGFEIRAPWNISIGEGTIIGDEAKLDGRCGITIGKNVNFSTGVWIWTLEHDLNDPYFGTTNKGGEVIIGDRVWLSCRTVVLPRIRIGEGAVVAAGAVVSKDCDAFKVYGGIPAKAISNRNNNLCYMFDGKHDHFL
jgi:acetyltransferase-like isoleucine patch superfamily enzyme